MIHCHHPIENNILRNEHKKTIFWKKWWLSDSQKMEWTFTNSQIVVSQTFSICAYKNYLNKIIFQNHLFDISCISTKDREKKCIERILILYPHLLLVSEKVVPTPIGVPFFEKNWNFIKLFIETLLRQTRPCYKFLAVYMSLQ